MTTSISTTPEAAPAVPANRLPAWAWLALGAVATLLTGPRWGIAPLAWVAVVPYLVYVRRARSWRSWLALLGVLLVAFPLQLLSIVTPPIPPVAVLAFGAPSAIGTFLMLGFVELVRRRTSEVRAVLGFAALVALFDWVGFRHTELGAWTTTSNSQVDELAIVQLASLVGLAGLGFVMAWCNATVAYLLAAPRPLRRAPVIAFGVVVLAALGYGAVRLDHPAGGRDVVVAAVVTDLGLDAGIPDATALAANTELLFARTRVAATRGARLVVWNEAAAFVAPEGEAALVARAQREARTLGIDLVLAYGVLLGTAPLEVDNKYAFVTSEGEIAETYRKHHPVPGEPSLRGTDPIGVIARPYGRVAGAICYDYDFPALAREHARLGAELVFVPASDWRGIDPVHTLMARVRAIEGGFAVVRATRAATSAAFDSRGRVRGWMSVAEANDRILIASVPIGRVETVYAALGDAPVGLAALWIASLLGMIARGWLRRPRR